MSLLFDTSEEKTNGTRLARLLIDGATHALREFLHSLHPPEKLPTVLNNKLILFQNLKTRRKIFESQWETLFPSSGEPPDTATFDITLLHLLLREICNLTEPATGWHDLPADNDDTKEAHIVRLKCFRNELCHSISTGISNDEFEAKWEKVSCSLVELGLDPKEIDRLKTEPIDHDIRRRLEEIIKSDLEPRMRTMEQELNQLKEQIAGLNIRQEPCASELLSCLPDEVPVFGRSREIQQATKAIQSGSSAIVVITGAPGFGKTTVANKVAHELAEPQRCRTVFYCSLRSKATLNDVATSMILACSTNQSQPPDNPQNWLLNWSKQQSRSVTFILDYADDAVEYQDSRDQFVCMMHNMRTLSKQKVTFLITSRKVFLGDRFHSKIKNIAIVSLWPDDAKELLLSKVHDDKTREKLTQTERLVKLCAGVPLALCIVGSLLSDYKESKLIANLEKAPLAVLESEEMSLKNTIKTSFDLLDPREQQALAILSVFPGSFDTDAAETLIMAKMSDSESQPMVILRSLKNRSLLEQPSAGRCLIHQLIQAFAKEIGRMKCPHVFDGLEKVACDHFMSRLAQNAELYWSKDKCKESIETFNEDRYNFECFLQVYVDVMAENPYVDPLLEQSTQMFLDRFPQKCMYLEMCLLPRFYVMALEKLLIHFNKSNHAVHKLELLCLLGHEKRKVGNSSEYNGLMKQAKRVYAENYSDFRSEGLSQVLFFNSYARSLFEKKVPKSKQWSDEVFEIAFFVCNIKLRDHPETAATLLQIGKRRKDIDTLQKATDLFTQCLGAHHMTAQGYKAIADVYFARGNTDTELSMSSLLYQKALTIMEECGMGGHKETALTLKNYGVCHKNKGNFQEAANFLERAKRVADVQLEEDHRWKVTIDTQLALLHEHLGRVEEAITLMKNALAMNSRLQQSLDWLGNKREIKGFLYHHPEATSSHVFSPSSSF